MRNYIINRPILLWTITILTLGNFYSYQRGWENAIITNP